MTTTTADPVTVIGLGPMGQAMVRSLLDGNHPVTVWNRTPDRAKSVTDEGARLAASVADAVRASPVLILSLTDYQAMYTILDPALAAEGDDLLHGKVIVNLSSDTPDRSREASRWASERGARFVTGGVMVPAPVVGTADAYVYYSGPKDVIDDHRHTLGLLGALRYVGEDPGMAQLFYQAQLDIFLTALSGLLHGVALVGSAGVPAKEFMPGALEILSLIPDMLGDGASTAGNLDDGVHPGDLSTTTMMAATADHILTTSVAAGIDVELPRAIKSHYDRAIASGHGRDDWTSLFEIIKRNDGASRG